MNFIYVIHWLYIYVIHWLYWKHLTDLIIRSRSNRNNRIHCDSKKALALRARPPLLSLLPLLFLLRLLLLLCVIRWFQYNMRMT